MRTNAESPTAVTLDHLVDEFAIFMIDQFGVLHDGQRPYPGAIDALQRIKQAGKHIVLLSNSGKRASINEVRLSQFGFDRQNYDVFLTSGEVAWQALHHTLIGSVVAAGGRCLLLARDDDSSAIDGLDLTRTTTASDADVIVLSGVRDGVTFEDYEHVLKTGVERDIPCLCTNPDKQMLTAAGIRFGSGALADRYAELGGQVTFIGKPYPAIYDTALSGIDGASANQAVCLGDSVEHDIAGGHNAGCATALVCTGIAHAQDAAARQASYAQFGVVPNYLLPSFSF